MEDVSNDVVDVVHASLCCCGDSAGMAHQYPLSSIVFVINDITKIAAEEGCKSLGIGNSMCLQSMQSKRPTCAGHTTRQSLQALMLKGMPRVLCCCTYRSHHGA